MFEAEIIWVSGFFKGRKGGVYRLIVMRPLGLELEKVNVYLNPDLRNYAKWEPLLREGTVVKNLIWKNKEKGVVDADSPVETVESQEA